MLISGSEANADTGKRSAALAPTLTIQQNNANKDSLTLFIFISSFD
jgi:hypothetical protein